MSLFQPSSKVDFKADSLIQDADLPRLLYRLSVMATLRSDFSKSQDMVNALRAIRPDSEVPFIALALLQFARGQKGAACETLTKDVLKKDPANELAQAYLAFFIFDLKHYSECKEILNGLLEQDLKEDSVKRFAKEMLDHLKQEGH